MSSSENSGDVSSKLIKDQVIDNELQELIQYTKVLTEILEGRLEIRNQSREKIGAYIENMGIDSKRMIQRFKLEDISYEKLERIQQRIVEMQQK